MKISNYQNIVSDTILELLNINNHQENWRKGTPIRQDVYMKYSFDVDNNFLRQWASFKRFSKLKRNSSDAQKYSNFVINVSTIRLNLPARIRPCFPRKIRKFSECERVSSPFSSTSATNWPKQVSSG